jgi:hypothetical protein
VNDPSIPEVFIISDRDLPGELEQFPRRGIEQLLPDVGDICRAYGLDRADSATVDAGYRTVRQYLGPFNTWISAHILRDLRAQLNREPDRRVAFIGRDGHVIAAATRGLDPQLFARNGVELQLSRRVVEAAMLDHERITGQPFPLSEKAYRTMRGWITEEDAVGTVENLAAYLRTAEIPVGVPGAGLTLVDNGLRGGLGEALHEIYDLDTFTHLAVASISDADPRPDSKKGHLFHLGAEQWQGGPVHYLPDDPRHTFLSNQGLHLWEGLTVGPHNTIAKMTAEGPQEMAPSREDSENVTPEQWRNPRAIQAMHTAVLLAAHHHAEQFRGRPLDAVLEATAPGRDEFTQQVRNWITQHGEVDQNLAVIMELNAGRLNCPTEAAYREMQALTAKTAAGVAAPRPGVPTKTDTSHQRTTTPQHKPLHRGS